MSEFYKLRRSKITDALALLGFVVGFIVPAYTAATHLIEGFENPGQETAGLTVFVLSLLRNALVGGVLGLIAGIAVGWIWEQVHKSSRPGGRLAPMSDGGEASALEEVQSSTGFASGRAPAHLAENRSVAVAGSSTTRPDASIRFDNAGFAVNEFLALTRKVIPGDYDAARTGTALEKTINIGAWDGERLVGAIRVLSDGYLYSTIPEVIVDPEYRRRGIGRELMLQALELSATGVVLLGSPPESAGFFERLGCHRAPSGYVLRRKKAATVQVR